jgi:hypothetical protein
MLGKIDYDDLVRGHGWFGLVVPSIFYIMFNLCLVLSFIAINMSTYMVLKQKTELHTAALAKLAAENSKALTQKW